MRNRLILRYELTLIWRRYQILPPYWALCHIVRGGDQQRNHHSSQYGDKRNFDQLRVVASGFDGMHNEIPIRYTWKKSEGFAMETMRERQTAIQHPRRLRGRGRMKTWLSRTANRCRSQFQNFCIGVVSNEFREIIGHGNAAARDLRSSRTRPREQTFRLLADDPAEKRSEAKQPIH